MAVPFRRTSKTKKRMRRTHLKKQVAGMTVLLFFNLNFFVVILKLKLYNYNRWEYLYE